MLDENEICEEVVALLDRMDKFPEEFLDDESLHRRWRNVMAHIQHESDTPVFTAAELRALREKVQGLARLRMKKEILQNIVHGEPEEPTIDDIVLRASRGRATMSSAPIQTLTTNNTGVTWQTQAEEQKEETRKIFEQYKQMMREKAEEAKKAKRAKRVTY